MDAPKPKKRKLSKVLSITVLYLVLGEFVRGIGLDAGGC
jgi:hypothetical protein